MTVSFVVPRQRRLSCLFGHDALLLLLCAVVTIEFVESELEVNEYEGVVEICVRKNLETAISVTLDLAIRNGSAFGNQIDIAACTLLKIFLPCCYVSAGSDYISAVSTITILPLQFLACFTVEIVRDTEREDAENFFVELSYSGAANVSLLSPTTITVVIFGKCSYLDEQNGTLFLGGNRNIHYLFSERCLDINQSDHPRCLFGIFKHISKMWNCDYVLDLLRAILHFP